jgi:hypothetical protein
LRGIGYIFNENVIGAASSVELTAGFRIDHGGPFKNRQGVFEVRGVVKPGGRQDSKNGLASRLQSSASRYGGSLQQLE